MTVDPRRPVDELRAMSDRMRQLEDRIERLAAPSGSQVARLTFRLANAIATDSATSVSYTQNNLTTPVDNFDAALLSFDRPAGATRATVLASGVVVFGGSYNSPAGGLARLRIGGADGPSSFSSAPVLGQYIVGGIPEDGETSTPQNVRTLVHARTFDVSAAALVVSTRVNVTTTFGGGSSMVASIVATVFWSAP